MSEPENLIEFLVNGNGVKGLSDLNLKNIPAKFIQPPEERLGNIQVTTQQHIPIIDVSEWETDPKVAESICEAAAKWGFFQIINHGIPIEVLENVQKAVHNFFELPFEERSKYIMNKSPSNKVMLKTSFNPLVEDILEWKDYLSHICDGKEDEDHKLWSPVSRDQVWEYLNHTKPIIQKLLKTLLDGINVKEIDEVKRCALMGLIAVNLLYYPICPNPDLVAGTGRHSDMSSITLLLQDDAGGLYVRAPEGDDMWVHATPLKGAFLVNIGDPLQIMSNDKYKSIEHRVYVSGNRNRVSVPVFATPSLESSIGPLKEVMEDGEKAVYRDVVFKDYFGHFYGKGHDGKRTIEYAKI